MELKSTSNWYDFGSLAGLRAQAGQRPSEAQSSVAEQFESLFINMMLKEMRKTVSRSDLLGSEAMESYEQMFDQQIALGMARAGGIGLALSDRIRINNWDEVAFIILLILGMVACIDLTSRKLRLKLIRPAS